MEKLILTHCWGDEVCSGTSYIPFEYKSKDDFVFDILERYKNHEWIYYKKYPNKTTSDYDTSEVEVLDNVFLSKGALEDIEGNVLTLEKWFEQHKIKI